MYADDDERQQSDGEYGEDVNEWDDQFADDAFDDSYGAMEAALPSRKGQTKRKGKNRKQGSAAKTTTAGTVDLGSDLSQKKRLISAAIGVGLVGMVLGALIVKLFVGSGSVDLPIAENSAGSGKNPTSNAPMANNREGGDDAPAVVDHSMQSGGSAPTSQPSSVVSQAIKNVPTFEVAWPELNTQGALNHLPGEMRGIGAAFQLPDEVEGTAYDPVSRHLAFNSKTLGVLIYNIDKLMSGDLAPAAVFPLTGEPAGLTMKNWQDQQYFVASSKGEASLKLIDAATLKQSGRIDLSSVANYATGLQSSKNPADPYVYFYNPRISPQPDATLATADSVGRASLASMTMESMLPQRSTDSGFHISANGRKLRLKTDRNRISNAPWEKHAESTSSGPMLVLAGRGAREISVPVDYPNEQMFYDGAKSVTTDLKVTGKLQPYDFEVFAFHPEPRMAIGVDKDLQLCLADPLTQTTFERIPLPRTIREARDSSGYSIRTPIRKKTEVFQITSDDELRLLITVSSNTLILLPLDHSKAPETPWLITKNRPASDAGIGTTIEMPIEFYSDEPVRIVPFTPEDDLIDQPLTREEFNLKTGFERGERLSVRELAIINAPRRKIPWKRPAGIQWLTIAANGEAPLPGQPFFEGNVFRWSPTNEQMGKTVVRFKVKSGDTEVPIVWDFFVRQRPTLELPFQIHQLVLSHDGSRAFVWGTKEESSALTGQRMASVVLAYRRSLRNAARTANPPAPLPEAILAVIDVKQQRVICQRPYPNGVYAAAVSSDSVFICDIPEGPEKSPLEPDPTRIVQLSMQDLTEVSSTAMKKATPNMIVIGDRLLVTSDGDQLTIPDLRTIPAKNFQTGVVADGYISEGVLWDAELTTPKLMTTPLAFCGDEIVGHHNRFEYSFKDGAGIRVTNAGRFTSTYLSQIVFGSGNAHLPMSQTIAHSREFPGSFGGRRTSSGIDLLFTPEGTPPVSRNSRTLIALSPQNTQSRSQQRRGGPMLLVKSAPGVVVACWQKQVFVESTAGMLPNKFPFHLDEQQSAFSLPLGKATRLSYSADGATEYSLEVGFSEIGNRTPLTELISTNGEFDIKIDSFTQLQHLLLNQLKAHGSRDRTVAIAAFQQSRGRLYKQLTGRWPTTVPFPLYAIVKAKDQNGRQAALAHWLLLDVPVKEAEKIIETHQW